MAMNNLALGIGVGVAVAGLFARSGGPGKSAPIVKWEGEDDYRVKLLVPSSYTENTNFISSTIKRTKGIIFPYTPSVAMDHTASYGNLAVTHANYPINFYKNSSIGNISLTAKFTVQNQTDAVEYLSVVHLLRALTKMQTGSDLVPGAPPPVCRLKGYGDMLISNVPVAVATFKLDLPENVDYYKTTPVPETDVGWLEMGTHFVPTVSSITLTLIPMYSREELANFSVDNFLRGYFNIKGQSKGYI